MSITAASFVGRESPEPHRHREMDEALTMEEARQKADWLRLASAGCGVNSGTDTGTGAGTGTTVYATTPHYYTTTPAPSPASLPAELNHLPHRHSHSQSQSQSQPSRPDSNNNHLRPIPSQHCRDGREEAQTGAAASVAVRQQPPADRRTGPMDFDGGLPLSPHYEHFARRSDQAAVASPFASASASVSATANSVTIKREAGQVVKVEQFSLHSDGNPDPATDSEAELEEQEQPQHQQQQAHEFDGDTEQQRTGGPITGCGAAALATRWVAHGG